MEQITVLVPNDDLDSVVREMLKEVAEQTSIRVIIAGPGEGALGGIELPKIKSKFHMESIKAYRKIMKREAVNVTFSPSTTGLSTMLFASLGLKVRNIGYRGTQAKVRRTDPTHWLAMLNPRVAHIVCETPDIERYLSHKIPSRKLSTACKPFKLEWVDEAMANPKAAPNGQSMLRLIYIGMSAGRPHKGLRVLLEAMHRVADKDISLTVIGSVDKADVDFALKSVTFLGARRDAVDYLPTHNLYVLPSVRDASPRVLREAQACGVPCIVSDIEGARDLIVPGKTGLLVPVTDVDALTQAITKLYDDPALLAELASNCRPHIAEKFDAQAYVDYHIKLFENEARKLHD